MARRQSIKPVNVAADVVAVHAQAEKARKAASRKALREAKAKTALVAELEKVDPDAANIVEAAQLLTRELAQEEDFAAQRRHDNLIAAQLEAAATGMTLAEACESMGIDESGNILEAEKPRYSGPMLALVSARKAYTKGANGNPHTNDAIGEAFSHLPAETVIQLCIELMNLQSNPYAHLNRGQQSMNLRNKLRQMVRAGMLPISHIQATAARAGR